MPLKNPEWSKGREKLSSSYCIVLQSEHFPIRRLIKICEYIKRYSCCWCSSSVAYLIYGHIFMQGSWEISPLVLISMCTVWHHIKWLLLPDLDWIYIHSSPSSLTEQLPYFLSKTSLRAMTVPEWHYKAWNGNSAARLSRFSVQCYLEWPQRMTLLH